MSRKSGKKEMKLQGGGRRVNNQSQSDASLVGFGVDVYHVFACFS